MKAKGVGMAVKAKKVGRDHPEMHGFFLCFPFSFVTSLVTSSFPFSLSCFPISFSFPFSFVPIPFPFYCFSILWFWEAGLRGSGSPARAGRAGRGHTKAHRGCSGSDGATAMALWAASSGMRNKSSHTHLLLLGRVLRLKRNGRASQAAVREAREALRRSIRRARRQCWEDFLSKAYASSPL